MTTYDPVLDYVLGMDSLDDTDIMSFVKKVMGRPEYLPPVTLMRFLLRVLFVAPRLPCSVA